MLAAGVLPLATAYSISEALGFEKGVSSSFREAPIFLGVFTFLVVLGATDRDDARPTADSRSDRDASHQRRALPVILIAVLKLVNNRELMGAHVNGPLYNIAAWLTTIIVSVLSILVISQRLFSNLF